MFGYESNINPITTTSTYTGNTNTPVQTPNSDIKVFPADGGKKVVDPKLQAFLDVNGWTVATFNSKIANIPNGSQLTLEQQIAYLVNNDPMLVNPEGIEQVVEGEQVVDGEPNEHFNHAEFSKLSVDDKKSVVLVEIAKNVFLTSQQGKTIEDWNKLSDDERNQYITQIKQGIGNKQLKNGESLVSFLESYSDLFPDKNKDFGLSLAMNTIQACNAKGISIAELEKMTPKEKMELTHEYILSLYEDDVELTDGQRAYIDELTLKSNAIRYEAEQKGIKIDSDGIMSPTDIAKSLEAIDCSKKDTLGIQINYLEQKVANGTATEADRLKLNELKQLVEVYKNLENVPKEKSGRLEAFQKSEYAEFYQSAGSIHEKVSLLKAYADKNFANLSPEEYAKAITELAVDIGLDGPDNYGLAAVFIKNVYTGASVEQRAALAGQKDAHVQGMISVNQPMMSDDDATISATAQREIYAGYAGNPELQEAISNISKLAIDNSTESQIYATRDIWSGYGFADVEITYADNALDKLSGEQERLALNAVAENSCQEARVYAGTNIHRADKENQIPLAEAFIKDKVVANAMNEAGTLTKCHHDNQVKMFEMMQERFHQSDYTKDEAISQLNTLADQIADCDRTNQLAMHEKIMDSKYTEVQEHAASNINKYDPTVQNAAMEKAYETQKASVIAKAIASSEKFAQPDVKKIEQERAAEYVEKIFKERFTEGTLTSQEIAQLTGTQKREYYNLLFKNADPARKIELLEQMGGAQKEVVYTYIALYDPALFRDLVVNCKGTAVEILSVCNDGAVRNKVMTEVFNSGNEGLIKEVKDFANRTSGQDDVARRYDENKQNDDNIAYEPDSQSLMTNPMEHNPVEIGKKLSILRA